MDVALAAGGASWETAVVREIEASRELRLMRRCVDVADLLAVASTGSVGAALVSVDMAGFDADVVHRLEAGGVRVAAVEAEPERCRALGISRSLSLGGLDVVAGDAVDVATRPLAGSGRLVAVWGPAGAPGRSTVALSLAASAAARRLDTVLVDADTAGGAQAQMLAVLDDVSGLAAACRAANQGRVAEVTEHLLVVGDGLRVLTGLQRGDMWGQARAGALDLVLRELRSSTDVVVVDVGGSIETGPGGAGRDQATRQVLELADSVVVVGRPDPVGLARLVRGLHELAEVVTEPPTILVNMVRRSLGWSQREVAATVERLCGIRPAGFLPFDQDTLDLALISGRTPREVASSSPFVDGVETLATALLDGVSPREAMSASTS